MRPAGASSVGRAVEQEKWFSACGCVKLLRRGGSFRVPTLAGLTLTLTIAVWVVVVREESERFVLSNLV